MGYRGKLQEREEARQLRSTGMTMPDIASRLGVSRSSVSLWTRDVPVTTGARRSPTRAGPNRLQQAKAAEIAATTAEGIARIGPLSDRDLLIAGTALYAGEGSKTPGAVTLVNSDPRMIELHLTWLRTCFTVDESRLRVRLYLHEGLDLGSATSSWSQLTGIPISQFCQPHRAVPDATVRHNKHEHGCTTIRYSCTRTHRAVMGLIDALLASSSRHSGVAQLAEQGTVNAKAVGSSPTPGAHVLNLPRRGAGPAPPSGR